MFDPNKAFDFEIEILCACPLMKARTSWWWSSMCCYNTMKKVNLFYLFLQFICSIR